MNQGRFLLKGQHGLQLQGSCWLPDGKPKAVICLVHGLGEHRGRYKHVAEAFVKAGYGLYAYDQRGHGESEGKRGFTPSFEILLQDLDQVLHMIHVKNEDAPLFVYGHSLGGNVVANYLLYKQNKAVKGGILTSPWLWLTKKPPGIQVWLARQVVKLFPTFSQGHGLKSSDLTHDPEYNKGYERDPLNHTKLSGRLFLGAYPAGKQAVEEADRLTVPTLLMHGTADAITDPAGSTAFAERAGKLVTLKLWEGLYHETHNEYEKAEVIQTIVDWLDAQTD